MEPEFFDGLQLDEEEGYESPSTLMDTYRQEMGMDMESIGPKTMEVDHYTPSNPEGIGEMLGMGGGMEESSDPMADTVTGPEDKPENEDMKNMLSQYIQDRQMRREEASKRFQTNAREQNRSQFGQGDSGFKAFG